jgi:RNA polymerase sigma-70 factor (ECF subfamily)
MTRSALNVQDSARATEWDDQDLVREVQSGDAKAFEHLYEKHVGRIYALCLRMLSDHHLAEEVTQDVFVRAWENIDSFEFRSTFRTWLHRLGVNVVLGHIRSAKRRDNRTWSVADIESFEREVNDAMPETRLDLEAAIATLPPGAKEVLILHDIQGYRYREIADLVGTAEGTVKSQLSRARRLVREALAR